MIYFDKIYVSVKEKTEEKSEKREGVEPIDDKWFFVLRNHRRKQAKTGIEWKREKEGMALKQTTKDGLTWEPHITLFSGLSGLLRKCTLGQEKRRGW